jgi:hypothetical protein
LAASLSGGFWPNPDYKPAVSHGFGRELDLLCLAVHHDVYFDPAAG